MLWDNSWEKSNAYRRQALFEVVDHERLNDGIDVALDEGGEVVKRQLDPVVGDAILGEIVSADALVALAAADLFLAFGGVFGVLGGHFYFEQTRAQDGEGPGLVFLLGT